MQSTQNPLLIVNQLTVSVKTHTAHKILVDGISFSVEKKSTMALVGGSGSGKTTTGLSIMQLLAPELKIDSGQIIFGGKDVVTLPESQMRSLRGKEIGMVFQEPLNAFNPVFSIGYQIDEVLRCHTNFSFQKRLDRVKELLNTVGIEDGDRVRKSYPHQLSGGLRQRAMIAQAIAGNPKLIIADEPTSNLDVTLQAKIIELFQKLKQELDLSILLITHELGVVEHLSDRVAVMSAGKIVEQGNVTDILNNPKEDYTRQLLEVLQ